MSGRFVLLLIAGIGLGVALGHFYEQSNSSIQGKSRAVTEQYNEPPLPKEQEVALEDPELERAMSMVVASEQRLAQKESSIEPPLSIEKRRHRIRGDWAFIDELDGSLDKSIEWGEREELLEEMVTLAIDSPSPKVKWHVAKKLESELFRMAGKANNYHEHEVRSHVGFVLSSYWKISQNAQVRGMTFSRLKSLELPSEIQEQIHNYVHVSL